MTSAFTFFRNMIINGNTFEESKRTLLLQICEYVIAVRLCGDDTISRMQAVSDLKIRIAEA